MGPGKAVSETGDRRVAIGKQLPAIHRTPPLVLRLRRFTNLGKQESKTDVAGGQVGTEFDTRGVLGNKLLPDRLCALVGFFRLSLVASLQQHESEAGVARRHIAPKAERGRV